MKLGRYIFNTILIGMTLFIISFLSKYFSPQKVFFLSQYPYFIIFFGALGVVAYWICAKGLEKNSESSVLIALGSVVLKMLVSMVFALILIYGQRFDRLAFLISFFLPYFIYTAFEIYSLMYNLRALKKQ